MKLILSLILTQLLVSPLQAQTYDDIKTLSTSIGNKYGITLYFDTFPETSLDVDYELAKEKNYAVLYNYMQLFDQEFSKYPLSFIKKTKISKVAFVHTLTIGMMFLEVTGAPDSIDELLILDFLGGKNNKTYQKHVIHHEFYHMIEEQFNKNPLWKDPTWNQFNSSQDIYGIGGWNRRSPRVSEINHPDKGFVDLYAQSALEEDKAEVFAILFVRKEYNLVKEWIKEDEILLKKIEYLKNFLKSKDKNFTSQYWNKLYNNTYDHLE